MRWRFWAVAGQALHFGGRRMETIMRTAWLPVVLILLVQMVSVFLTFSLVTDRAITFEQTGSFSAAKAQLTQFQVLLFLTKPVAFWVLTLGTQLITLILLASFMAPLIRDAATGERPAPGFLHIPFGAGQLRYTAASLIAGIVPLLLVFAPVYFGGQALAKAVGETLGKGEHVSFPFDQSIHTIRPTALGDMLTGTSKFWIGDVALPVWLLAVPFLLLLAFLMHRHFKPVNRAESQSHGSDQRLATPAHPVRRAGVVIVALAASIGIVWVSMLDMYSLPGFLDRVVPSITIPEQARSIGFVVLSILLLFMYISVRIFPYPGYAVLDRSMRFQDVLRVTRGWNLFQMLGLVILLSVFVGIVFFIANLLLGLLFPIVWNVVGNTTATVTRMFNSGVMADWLLPIYIWVLNIVRLATNIFLMFFCYGVMAGVYGRLYAEAKLGEPYMPAR